MKILNITKYYLPITGGQSTYILNLKKSLERFSMFSFVLQPYSRIISEDYVIKLKHIPLLWKILDPWFIFNFQLIFKRGLIKKYDVVISHYPFHYPVLKWHKKVIVLSHGLDWHQPPVSKTDKYRRYTAELVKNEDCVLVANDSHFLRYLGFDVSPATGFFREVFKNKWFIPNAVNINLFFDHKIIRKKNILVPRTVRPERGIHIAIEAFHKFFDKYPDFTMDIVGFYDSRWTYYRECRDLIGKLGLERQINFVGAVDWKDLPIYYNQSLITLIPTVEMEGTSLSALESMACGTPVVSTRVGGLSDLPTHKAEADGNDLADKMDEILCNWEEFSQSQMTITRNIFNLENWSLAWRKVIDSINI